MSKVDVSKITVFFIMVRHPRDGWMRVGPQYPNRTSAQGWVSFVWSAWSGWTTKVSQCMVYLENGKVTARSRRVLDEKYNMNVPETDAA